MRFRTYFFAAFALVLAPLAASGDEQKSAIPKVDFGRQIRPVLAEKCYPCHGLDEETREAELRLDTREGILAPLESDEGYAVVPGKPEESLAYLLLVTEKKRKRMPPRRFKKEMTQEETELFRRWIEEGAEWQEHWSLVAPKRPELPEVRDASRVRNAIDRFVLARVEKEGLRPSAEADKTALLRRVTFDLTGLPPTPKEIDDFLADDSPEAYERVVDRLLESAHYGEHMGRYWLDAARYGDTHGLHLDNRRQIWPFRDWVIESFNRNQPFDEFTVEQLAGDLLPNATIEQQVATGFNRCNVTTSEGGVIPEEYHVHYTVDRVATMSTVWMGVSMGCVRCHEHKFDPFEMKDFYQLYAFFNSLDGPVMDGNKPLPAPVVQVPNKENRRKIAELEPQIAAARKTLDERRGAATDDFVAWEKAERARVGDQAIVPTADLIAHWRFDEAKDAKVPSAVEGVPAGSLRGAKRVEGKVGLAAKVGNKEFVDLGKETGNFEQTDAISYGAWVKIDKGNGGGAVLARMNDGNKHRGWDLYVSNGMAIAHFINTWPSNALKVQTKNKFKENEWQHLLVTYDGSRKPEGVKIYINGESSPLDVPNNSLNGTIKANSSLHVGRRSPGSALRGLVDDVRIYSRVLNATEAADLAGGSEIRDILAKAADKRSPEEQDALREHYLANHDGPYRELAAKVTKLEGDKRRLETEGKIETLVWRDKKPQPAHILIRGEYDKKGERVYRDTPAALPPLKKVEGETPSRLDLARWLMTPEHPLTARVTVNRFWQQYFGIGIVETAADFGSQGALPTHPELLDWLAVDFRESGWDVKRLQKMIVTSATYRQSSHLTPALVERDPKNRLLARGPRFRLDAEAIRDNALAVSGLLVRKLGGPGVKPYQPPGIWKAVGYTDSNTANFKRDSGEALYRRSVYTFWKRTAPPPALVVLDAPSRETCTVQRSRTNTPLAALALMNDEQFVEAARHLATRTISEGGDCDADRAAWTFRTVTSRQPCDDERAIVVDVYRRYLATYRADEEAARKLLAVGESEPPAPMDSAELAAWTMVGNLLLNLDETITKG